MLVEHGIRLDFRLTLDMGHETTADELKIFKRWIVTKIGTVFYQRHGARGAKTNIFRDNTGKPRPRGSCAPQNFNALAMNVLNTVSFEKFEARSIASAESSS